METYSRRVALAASATGALLASAPGAAAQQAVQGVTAMNFNALDVNSLRDLIDAARSNGPQLAEMMTRHLPGLQAGGAAAVPAMATPPTGGTSTVGTLASGNVAAVWGQDFLFALASEEPATISIDRQAQVPMTRIAGTPYWYRLEVLRTGVTHTFTLFSGGRDVGTNS